MLVSPREPAGALTQSTPAYCREPVMPITRLLADGSFTPAQRHVLELAFNNTLRKLNLVIATILFVSLLPKGSSKSIGAVPAMLSQFQR